MQIAQARQIQERAAVLVADLHDEVRALLEDDLLVHPRVHRVLQRGHAEEPGAGHDAVFDRRLELAAHHRAYHSSRPIVQNLTGPFMICDS